MSIITFWSNTKKQTAQTMSLAAIATSMAIEHNYKILIISTIYNDDTLELCFGDLNNNKKILNEFINLKNKRNLYFINSVIKNSFYKSGFLRNTGLFFAFL